MRSVSEGFYQQVFYLLAHEKLHGPGHRAEHPGDGAVVQGGLGDGGCHLSTVAPGLAHLLGPDRVGEVLGRPQVVHVPDVGLEELLLNFVLVVDDPHALHEAGEVADLCGPQVLQLLSIDVFHPRGPLLTTVGAVHAVDEGVGVVDGQTGHVEGLHERLGGLVRLHDRQREGR